MSQTLETIGTKPTGRATGTERWATITADDTDLLVTAYTGWSITDEVRLKGRNARGMASTIADILTELDAS